MTFAMACRRGDRVHFTYRDGSDRVSERRVEPHRLVSLGRRWYLVGFDLDRDDWRTYRIDRVRALVASGHRNTPRPTPDAGALVAEGVAVRVFDTRARVKVMAPAQEVVHHIGPTVGVIEPGDDTFCVVTIGGDHDWIARYLISLDFRFEVIEPREVNDELRALAERMLSQLAAHPLRNQEHERGGQLADPKSDVAPSLRGARYPTYRPAGERQDLRRQLQRSGRQASISAPGQRDLWCPDPPVSTSALRTGDVCVGPINAPK